MLFVDKWATFSQKKKYTFVFVFDAVNFYGDLLICMFALLFYLVLFHLINFFGNNKISTVFPDIFEIKYLYFIHS